MLQKLIDSENFIGELNERLAFYEQSAEPLSHNGMQYRS